MTPRTVLYPDTKRILDKEEVKICPPRAIKNEQETLKQFKIEEECL